MNCHAPAQDQTSIQTRCNTCASLSAGSKHACAAAPSPHLHAVLPELPDHPRLRASAQAALGGQHEVPRAAPRQPDRQREPEAAQAAGDDDGAVRPACKRQQQPGFSAGALIIVLSR